MPDRRAIFGVVRATSSEDAGADGILMDIEAHEFRLRGHVPVSFGGGVG
jgi:hypothetical protein